MMADRRKYFNPRSHERSDGAMFVGNNEFGIFQSTLPREERRRTNSRKVFEFSISIHAPTRGATQCAYSHPLRFTFQSTLPREERPQTLPLSDRLCHFNPRSHERSDRSCTKTLCLSIISIHAPTRGATLTDDEIINNALISIHAPTRGATAILHKKFVYFYTIPTINI